MKHPNIVRIREVILEKETLFLVFDFWDTNLFQVTQRSRLGEDVIRQAGAQMLCGLAHLHAHNVFHRDIKPEKCVLGLGLVSTLSLVLTPTLLSLLSAFSVE